MFCADKLAAMEARQERRHLSEVHRGPHGDITRNGKSYVSFACNDYLGLSHHEEVVEAARTALTDYGAGAGASRLITGNHDLYRQLETAIADWKGYEDCVVSGSGFLTNIGLIPALAGPEDLIFIDELAHACLFGGARMARSRTEIFPHNDVSVLATMLDKHRKDYRHCLILTDGVFSMDGDMAPLPQLQILSADHSAWLIVDDAHGFGVVGGGRGAQHAFDLPVSLHLSMGTLSKAAGSYGGYVCASHTVCEFLRNRMRSFVYTTGLPPSVVAASLKAMEIIKREPERCARPVLLANRFCKILGLPETKTPIVPLIVGSNENALSLQKELEAAGFLVTAIRPPTVPVNTARLRITFCADHRDEDVERLAATMIKMREQ